MAAKKKPLIGKTIKVTNKWINKMTKRGKLRKRDKKSRVLTQHQKRMTEMKKLRDERLEEDLESARKGNRDQSEDEEDDEALPLDMIDSDDELYQ